MLVPFDLWGPYKTISTCRASYSLTILDDNSRAIWVYMVAKKIEVSKFLKDSFAMVQTQFSKKIKVLRTRLNIFA